MAPKQSYICQNPYCQREFFRRPRNDREHRYCCKRCNKRTHPIRTAICTACHKKYEVGGPQHYGKFCSMDCVRNFRIHKNCPQCGREFTLSRSLENKRTCCSRKCDSEYRSTTSVARRLWKNVTKTDECWLWTATKNKQGYGQVYANGRLQLAHRVAYELNVGSILPGLHLLHRCDTPACVRPDHMFIGTHFDNMQDMIRKGRARWQKPKM